MPARVRHLVLSQRSHVFHREARQRSSLQLRVSFWRDSRLSHPSRPGNLSAADQNDPKHRAKRAINVVIDLLISSSAHSHVSRRDLHSSTSLMLFGDQHTRVITKRSLASWWRMNYYDDFWCVGDVKNSVARASRLWFVFNGIQHGIAQLTTYRLAFETLNAPRKFTKLLKKNPQDFID